MFTGFFVRCLSVRTHLFRVPVNLLNVDCWFCPVQTFAANCLFGSQISDVDLTTARSTPEARLVAIYFPNLNKHSSQSGTTLNNAGLFPACCHIPDTSLLKYTKISVCLFVCL